MHGYMRNTQRYREKDKRTDHENAVSEWIWSEIDHEDGIAATKNTA